jgi:hypothetical protein
MIRLMGLCVYPEPHLLSVISRSFQSAPYFSWSHFGITGAAVGVAGSVVEVAGSVVVVAGSGVAVAGSEVMEVVVGIAVVVDIKEMEFKIKLK